jgi:hypothetical protein
MAGAVIDVARERDQTLGRLQALAARIRAREQINGLGNVGTGGTRPIAWVPFRTRKGADSTRQGRRPWA